MTFITLNWGYKLSVRLVCLQWDGQYCKVQYLLMSLLKRQWLSFLHLQNFITIALKLRMDNLISRILQTANGTVNSMAVCPLSQPLHLICQKTFLLLTTKMSFQCNCCMVASIWWYWWYDWSKKQAETIQKKYYECSSSTAKPFALVCCIHWHHTTNTTALPVELESTMKQTALNLIA